ncbi:hypothetical protein D3C76_1081670 [compost metagenome]
MCGWRVGWHNHLGIEQLRQAFGKLQVHAVFVFGGVLTGIEQHDALLVVGRTGHGRVPRRREVLRA